MVRATSHVPSTGRAPSVIQIRKDRKKPYKIQLEQVVARKRKLKTKDIHGTVTPLKGYTFLPVGHADLAEHCKELSRKRGVEIALVSAGAKSEFARDPTSLSHHVHRVGYHFRTDIFDEACKWLQYKFVDGKLVRQMGAPRTLESQFVGVRPRVELLDPNDRSEEQSIRVKKYIRELFPKIPEADLEAIYLRAWQKGANTVGNAVDMSLSRQVQLATIARIRHTYTRYDQLLREVSWQSARKQCEHICLTKLVEWRGEHDNDPEELEEVLRETIVIEEDDSADEQGNEADGESDSDIEIVQQTIAPKDLRVDPNEAEWLPWRGGQTRPSNNTLPAAMLARWQNARNGGPPLNLQPENSHRIVPVPLDRQGNAPRSIVENGVKYTRISPAPQAVHAQQVPSRLPGLGPHYSVQPHSQPYGPSPRHGATQTIDLTTPPRHQPGRVLHYGAPPMIDLVTPPKTQAYYGTTVAQAPLLYDRPREVRPVSQMHEVHPQQQYPFMAPSRATPVDRSMDIPLPSREFAPHEQIFQKRDTGPAPHTEVYRGPPTPVYRQPVFGEPAFPQMSSQYQLRYPHAGFAQQPAHGAPAAIQHFSPPHRVVLAEPSSQDHNRMPRPQKYVPGFDQQRYYVPNR